MTFVTITLAISGLLLAYCAFLIYQLGKRLLEAIAHLHITAHDMVRAMDGKTLLKIIDREMKMTGRAFENRHLRKSDPGYIKRLEEVEKAGE